MSTLDEKREQAIEWLGDRWIGHPEHKPKPFAAPLVPLPNVAKQHAAIVGFDPGLLGQWRSILRGLTR